MGEQNKSFRPPFTKGGGFLRRSLKSPSAEGEISLTKRSFEGVRGTFLTKKSSPKLYTISYLSSKKMPVTSFLKQYIKSKSHALVETSSAYSDFLLCKKSVIRSTVSPLRKKYHSVQLLVCKRTRNAELSLTTFCGFWCVFSMFVEWEIPTFCGFVVLLQ